MTAKRIAERLEGEIEFRDEKETMKDAVMRVIDAELKAEREAAEGMRQEIFKMLREGVYDRAAIRQTVLKYERARKGE